MDIFSRLYSSALHERYNIITSINPLTQVNRHVQAAMSINSYDRHYLENLEFEKVSTVYSELPCGESCEKSIQEIIFAASIYGLKLYTGKYIIKYYDYKRRPTGREVSYDIIALKDNKGFSLELITDWDWVDHRGARPAIKVIFFKVRRDIQGSFYKAHEFLNGKIRKIFLDDLGYKFLYGSARYSTNSEIRYKYKKNGRDFDWRLESHFIGYDENLRPIVVSGLMLFYLRMGFIPVKFSGKRLAQFPDEVFPDDSVVMLGDAAKQDVIDEIGEDCFREYGSQSRGNLGWWRSIQREREAQIPEDVRKKLVETALEREGGRF